jgi:hypothetical protein
MINFLLKANSYHGAFPHWLDGATGRTIAFSRKDDGADLVETSYLFRDYYVPGSILIAMTRWRENSEIN